MANCIQSLCITSTLRSTIEPNLTGKVLGQRTKTSHGGLYCEIGLRVPVRVFQARCGDGFHSLQQTECSFNHILGKLIAKVQLLSVLTALALGIGVTKCAASCPPTISTAKKLRFTSAKEAALEPHYLSDAEAIALWLGVEHEEKSEMSHHHGAHTGNTTEFDEEETYLEDYRSNPYSITVPLRVVGLRGSVPPAWLKDFLGSQGKRVKLTAEFRPSLKSIFSELSAALVSRQLSSRSAMSADLVTIGDSWLSKAVSGRLVIPIENAEQYEWYHRMGSKWQFVRRDEQGFISSNGKVWGVPYRLGSLVIAYNRDKFERHGIPAITDWIDLWKPELAGRISMVASPREIVGVVLKALGASFNVKGFDSDVAGGRQAMEEKFLTLINQVRLFNDTLYLKTLGAEEVWVAVGWSHDIVSFAKRTSNIAVIAPLSGTSLWADLWAIPASTSISSDRIGGRIRGPSPLVLQWFDFCLQPARISSFQHDILLGTSPLVLSNAASPTSEAIQSDHDKLSLHDEANTLTRHHGILQHTQHECHYGEDMSAEMILKPDVIDKSEFLEPLSKTALLDFRWLLSKRPKNGMKVPRVD